MKYYKKAIEVEFEIYTDNGTEITKEGAAPYVIGDYRMIGIEGEIWPMKPRVFGKNYEIIESGIARKKKVIVDVEFAEVEKIVITSWGAVLTALIGDAIVTAGPDDKWVVSRSIFDKTYIYEPECPFGGDNTDCKSCVYYPDYEWDPNEEDCMRRNQNKED